MYLQDLIELEDHTEHDCRVWWPICPALIDLDNWTDFLFAHPDHEFASYSHSGLATGFHIGFNWQGPAL